MCDTHWKTNGDPEEFDHQQTHKKQYQKLITHSQSGFNEHLKHTQKVGNLLHYRAPDHYNKIPNNSKNTHHGPWMVKRKNVVGFTGFAKRSGFQIWVLRSGFCSDPSISSFIVHAGPSSSSSSTPGPSSSSSISSLLLLHGCHRLWGRSLLLLSRRERENTIRGREREREREGKSLFLKKKNN